MKTRLTLNPQRSTCLYLWSAGINSMPHYSLLFCLFVWQCLTMSSRLVLNSRIQVILPPDTPCINRNPGICQYAQESVVFYYSCANIWIQQTWHGNNRANAHLLRGKIQVRFFLLPHINSKFLHYFMECFDQLVALVNQDTSPNTASKMYNTKFTTKVLDYHKRTVWTFILQQNSRIQGLTLSLRFTSIITTSPIFTSLN